MIYGALMSVLGAAGMVKIKIIFWGESGSHKMRTIWLYFLVVACFHGFAQEERLK